MSPRWIIESGPNLTRPTADHRPLLFELRRDGVARQTTVLITGTAAACDPATLPYPIDDAVRTDGLSVLVPYLESNEPPAVIRISSRTIDAAPQAAH